jgi:hypothetical protein
MRKKFFLECLSSIYSHMGICTHFAHEKFAYGDPHVRKCLKKHISDRLFLHNEVVRKWGLTYISSLGGYVLTGYVSSKVRNE